MMNALIRAAGAEQRGDADTAQYLREVAQMEPITFDQIRDAIRNCGVSAVCVRDDDGVSNGYWTLVPTGANEWRVEHWRQGMSGIEDSEGLTDEELAAKIGDREVQINATGEPVSYRLDA